MKRELERRIRERVAPPQSESTPKVSAGQIGIQEDPDTGKVYLVAGWKDEKVYRVELTEVSS